MRQQLNELEETPGDNSISRETWCAAVQKVTELGMTWRLNNKRGMKKLQLTLGPCTQVAAILGNLFYCVDTGVGKCHFGSLALVSPFPGLAHLLEESPLLLHFESSNYLGEDTVLLTKYRLP